MNRDCKSALYEIISQNRVPEDCRHVFLCIIGITKPIDKLVIADLFGSNEASGDYTPEVKDAEMPLKDERLRTIQLVNIRSFYGDKNQTKRNFGLKLNVKNTPVSLFLVGSNSTGKSSIFSALEKYYTGMVSYAKAVNCNEINYMTFGFGLAKKADTELIKLDVGYFVESGHQKEKWEPLNKLNDITTCASFCSDYDIERIEKSSKNLNEFILEQLGYGDLFLLRKQIEFLLINLKDPYEISKQELLSSEWEEIIEAFIKLYNDNNLINIEKPFVDVSEIKKEISREKQQRHDIFSSRWDILSKGRASYNVEMGFADFFFSELELEKQGNVSVERLAMMYQTLFEKLEDLRLKNIVDVLDEMYMNKNNIFEKERKNAEMPISSENRREALATVLTLVKDKCDHILSTIYNDSHLFIEDILKRFSPPNETYRFNFDKGVVSMTILVETEKGTFPANPQDYLNTFRFKLYCVALKIALALSKMNERRISVPIVIDDIFNASDFENTLKLELFVYNIFKTYDEVLQTTLPLQLILLTHDEMVQGAFRRGIKLRLEEAGNVQLFQNDSYRDYFLCGRLFDKKDWAEYLKSEKNSDAHKFINLYLEN